MKKLVSLRAPACICFLVACAAPTAIPTVVPTAAPLPTFASPTVVPTLPLPTPATQPDRPRVLRIGQGSYPDVFDPQKAAFSGEIAILQLAYEGLTRLAEKGNVIPFDRFARTYQYE